MRTSEDIFYYLTVMNENYAQPPMPDGAKEGILRGMYRFKPAENIDGMPAQILGSGAILNEAIKAQKILREQYGVAADVWSVTSYKELHRDALEAERWNVLHPAENPKDFVCFPVHGRLQRDPLSRRPITLKSCPTRSAAGCRADSFPGNRRLRPERRPRFIAGFLRGRRSVYRSCNVVVPCVGQEDQTRDGFAGHEGFGNRSRKAQPDDILTGGF